ncbi:hypothetical protein BWI75_22415 [Gloeocapsopsis sp. AAB1 = 1H9]|uniref:Transposase n=1 Tax=Gloeocapsopsis dulcis AAB1 = 1H9 TaxID=1433147 RepID=A0A6N8G265_9CHRO|nr:IS1 family transposase [Gloeocapsopsis dulcis]MUL38982.1 hypothetical protein [Gloeocapsopsis dulcis AAB1 = 1H9]WNN90255.1 IS1 family transposase [Gloeocapsopsis dulcis]
MEVEIIRVENFQEVGIEESELDEMWSYVSKKSNPRWLWHAIDRRSRKVLAYVFGRRKVKYFYNSKNYWSHLELSAIVLMVGELMNGIYQQSYTR